MSNASLVRPGLTTAFVGELPAIKLRLRRKVPQLTFQDVRRAKIPFYEALASELYESGHVNAAFLMLQLIEFEHEYVPLTSESAIEDKRLKNSKNLLNFLFRTMREAEDHKIERRYEEEVEHLLMIARSFLGDPQKRWISRQFYLISLDRCEDGRRLEENRVNALARFLYGKFLAEEKQLDEAIVMLEQARDCAVGQSWKWTLEEGNVVAFSPLIDDIQRQLYFKYSAMRDRFKKTDPDLFELYMRLSHQAALDSNVGSVMSDSYLEFGDFLLDQEQYREALNCYKNSIKWGKNINATDKVCKTHIRVAAAHRRLNDVKHCEFNLNQVERQSADNKNTECYAEYQLLIGEMFFETNRLEEATKSFHKAREIYKYLKKEDRMIQACIFGALAHGETHFDEYANLIRKAEYRGPLSENENLFKLLRFNVDNEPFW